APGSGGAATRCGGRDGAGPCDGAHGVGHAGVRARRAVAARPSRLRPRGSQSARVGCTSRVGAARGDRPRADRPDRGCGAVNGWVLVLAAALVAAEAVRAYRREPRAARLSGRRSALATMAE